MVAALDRKLLRDLRHLRGQALTIALVVACGIASFVTLRGTWRSLETTRNDYYERYRFADVFAVLERAPNDVLERIEAIDGVARAEGRVVENVMLPVEDLPEPAVGRIVSLPPGGVAALNRVYLRSGRTVEPGTNEILLGEAFAKAHGLVPGDELPAVLNGTYRPLRIVGIAMSPEYVFAMAPNDVTTDDARYAIMWMSRATLATAFQMEGAFNDVSLRLQPGASVRAVLARLDAVLEPYGGMGAVGRAKQLSNYVLEGELTQLRSLATVIPAIFLAVAAFLLNVVLSRLVHLQRQEIAVLKALGYSNREVGLHYLELVSVVVVIGAILGVGVGAWLGRLMTGLYADFFRFPLLEYAVYPDVIATGLLVSIIAAASGALMAVRRVAHMPPAEAMRPAAPTLYRRGLFDKPVVATALGHSGMMVFRELRRRPLRLIVSALGIAAAIGILIVGRFSWDAFSYVVDELYPLDNRYDLSVAFREPVPARELRVIASLPGVVAAESLRVVPVRFHAGHRWRDSVIYGLADHNVLRALHDKRGRPVSVPNHGMVITHKLAEVLHIEPGMGVSVEVRAGAWPHVVIPVVGLVDEAFGMQAYMRQSALAARLGEQPAISAALLAVDPDQEGVLHRRLKQIPMVAAVTRTRTVIDRFHAQSGRMMTVTTLILTLFAATIAVGVVYNNARVALSVRGRDLASLRVLGFTRAEISAVLLGELAVQLLVAIPIGLVLGRWWAAAVSATADPETYRLPILISSKTYAIAVLVATGAGILSALLVRHRLDHLDLIGVLKTRE